MAHIQYVDELVKEYLLFRGFTHTLKTFDSELKVDKDKGFRVDKIIDQFLGHITSYDLASIRELWNHFESHLFSRLEHHLASSVKKFENSIYKMYLVNAVVNNKSEKITDFFKVMTPELQSQNEWKEWFMLPFTKNPEENPAFGIYFTKQWQDTVLVSLHNFLATVFQWMPQPTLTNFEDGTRLRRLQEENESLKNRLLKDRAQNELTPVDVLPPPAQIFDDFYVIAQEQNTPENQVKTLKSMIKNIGSSPTMTRKQSKSKASLPTKSFK